jgi:hypothetical protein
MSGSPMGSAHNSDTENDPKTPGLYSYFKINNNFFLNRYSYS